MLLEFYDGKLPRFLSPIELLIYPINDEALIKADVIKEVLMKKGIRAQVDKRMGNHLGKRMVLGRKLRAYASMVIGDKELSNEQFLVKLRDGGEIELKDF